MVIYDWVALCYGISRGGGGEPWAVFPCGKAYTPDGLTRSPGVSRGGGDNSNKVGPLCEVLIQEVYSMLQVTLWSVRRSRWRGVRTTVAKEMSCFPELTSFPPLRGVKTKSY